MKMSNEPRLLKLSRAEMKKELIQLVNCILLAKERGMTEKDFQEFKLERVDSCFENMSLWFDDYLEWKGDDEK